MGFSTYSDNRDVNDKYEFPNNCDNQECQYMTTEGCKFEYCAFDDCYPKLETDTSTYICEICENEFTRANKKITHHFCDKCLAMLQSMEPKRKEDFTCKICGGEQTGKVSELPESDICDKCFRELVRYILQARDLYIKEDFEERWGEDE